MTKEKIFEVIKSLAKSQGYYCGLLSSILASGGINSEVIEILHKQNFRDSVDMVMWIEG